MPSASRRLNIELPAERADMVAAKLASGEYASESEVIAQGLSYFQTEAERLEHRLRTEVAAAHDGQRRRSPHQFPVSAGSG